MLKEITRRFNRPALEAVACKAPEAKGSRNILRLISLRHAVEIQQSISEAQEILATIIFQ